MFELTVTSDFTLPDGGPGRRYVRGEAVIDAGEVTRILNSEFHINVTKVNAGTHSVPAAAGMDDEMAWVDDEPDAVLVEGEPAAVVMNEEPAVAPAEPAAVVMNEERPAPARTRRSFKDEAPAS